MNEQIKKWQEELRKPSGNLTTNHPMPENLISQLLDEDISLKEKLDFSEVDFLELEGILKDIKGLDILKGIQKYTEDGYLTLFRAVRFPTYKRIYNTLHKEGYSALNYEQERILALYNDEEYKKKREEISRDPSFWTQPQERVVEGLPVFYLANDALQIHRAFRGEEDKVLMIAIHIPHELFETRKVKLTSNSAIDLSYSENKRDFEIRDFIKSNGSYQIDFETLRVRGIDLHEMYINGLPMETNEAENVGIKQDFFLLDIYKLDNNSKMAELKENTKLLKDNKDFLHGFFGDQNIFGRRKSEYLPSECQKIKMQST